MCALTMALLQLQSAATEILCGGLALLSSIGQSAYNLIRWSFPVKPQVCRKVL